MSTNSSASNEFKAQVKAAFESVELEKQFIYRRTFTDADLALFCGISGDFNPFHMDDEFARQSWFGRRTLPGLLTASMATHLGGMIGFLATEMTFEYLAPVYPGDTITCVMRFTERDEAKRLLTARVSYTNQDGVEVLRARVLGFPSQIRLAQ
jgi:3-hydroxybutyryl-CoA dehydratase